jgi:hypothetical protein
MWSCPRARRSVPDIVGRAVPGPRGGHATTETDHRQPRQPTAEVPETKGSNASASNQRARESIDTVGVRSSILRSPTLSPPDSGGFSHFRTVIGPRWGHAGVGWRWIGQVRVWPRMGHQNFSGSFEGWFVAPTRDPPEESRRRLGATDVGHGEQRQVVAGDRTAGAPSRVRAQTERVRTRPTRSAEPRSGDNHAAARRNLIKPRRPATVPERRLCRPLGCAGLAAHRLEAQASRDRRGRHNPRARHARCGCSTRSSRAGSGGTDRRAGEADRA